jgi:hypothetical protein
MTPEKLAIFKERLSKSSRFTYEALKNLPNIEPNKIQYLGKEFPVIIVDSNFIEQKVNYNESQSFWIILSIDDELYRAFAYYDSYGGSEDFRWNELEPVIRTQTTAYLSDSELKYQPPESSDDPSYPSYEESYTENSYGD